MKNLKLVLIGVLIGLFAQTAQAFPIRVSVSGNAHQVVAEACNFYYSTPLYCRVTAYGMLPNGLWINAFVNYRLPPGLCESAYVYANYPHYFIDGRGTANCDYIY